MLNKEHKLTVDDLIVEYMVCKVKEGYEPSFTSDEFIDFLHFFTSKINVEDCMYKKELFDRFFERKNEADWSYSKTFFSNEKIYNPHMELDKTDEANYLIKANYKLSDFDISVINTYFIYSGDRKKITDRIKVYLKDKPKRKINMDIQVNENELMIGKYISSQIFENIWTSHINELINDGYWPRQCKDINKYLLNTDLAKIIEVKSIKDELLNFYKSIYQKLAIMYHQDKKLKISTFSNSYLSYSNYNLLRDGHEKMFDIAFGMYKSNLDIDIEKLEFSEIHEEDGVYDIDEDAPIVKTNVSIQDDKVKKLVRNIELNL